MLELRELMVRFGGLKALDGVSLTVGEGEIVGLIGPNGAGKTTAFNAVSRFVPAAGGSVRFLDRDVLRAKPHQLIEFGIARTFQNLGLFPYLTVTQNLMLGQHHQVRTPPLLQPFRPRRARDEEAELGDRAVQLLKRLGLESIAEAYVANLPYGVQKFVEIGRALVSVPKLVLLDEPAAGLTSAETERIRELILRSRDEFGITVLLIEHDMSLVMRTCDHVAALDFGKLIAHGTPDEIQNHPQVIEAYLGQTEVSDA